MKKIQITSLVAALTALSFAGCNSSSSFELAGKVDIYQEFGDYESALYSAHVLYNANHDIAQSTVLHNGLPLTPHKLSEGTNWYFTQTTQNSDIEDVLGAFTISATDTEGKTVRGDIIAAFAGSRLMGKLEVESLEYTNSVLKATIRKQAGIDQYAFYILVGNNTNPFLSRVVGTEDSLDPDVVNIFYQIADDDQDKKLTVSVAALQHLYYKNGSLIQRSITRTLEPGAGEFTEGNYPQNGE